MKQIQTLLIVALFTVFLVLSSAYQPTQDAYAQNGTLPPSTVAQTAPPTAWCDENPCEREPPATAWCDVQPCGQTTPPTSTPVPVSTFTVVPPMTPAATFTPTDGPFVNTGSTDTPVSARQREDDISSSPTPTPQLDLAGALLGAARQQPLLAVDPRNPLTDRLLAAGYAPVSPIFAGRAASLDYTAQRGENLLSGEGRIFYWLENDRSRVRTVALPLADNDAFALALLRESSVQQHLHLNPHAALQHQISQADFLPISNEFTLTFRGVGYIAQIAQGRRGTTRRVYYVAAGAWEQVEAIAFN